VNIGNPREMTMIEFADAVRAASWFSSPFPKTIPNNGNRI
jgi:hypothetical protein